jgi:pimeloyl-ACP methyl ester carboxylesterase
LTSSIFRLLVRWSGAAGENVMKRAVFATAVALSLVLTVAGSGSAAVFQYAVPVATARGEREAFLWIPPKAQYVRGIVLGGMTLAERELAQDPRIRAACADEHLAIVFVKCGIGSVDVQQMLDDLGRLSGYRELSSAPLFLVGHSAGGPQAKQLAIEMASRCFGLVQYRGGVPGGEQPVPPGVPVLMMIGQFDEFGGTMRDENGRETWEGGRDALAVFRGLDARNLASLVVEPGAGHFAWSDRNAEYLALFIRKAARARIPSQRKASPNDSGSVTLLEIDHRRGWLTDLASIHSSDAFPAASWEADGGDKRAAAWHFDREIAEATVAYHAGGFGKRDQFIRWNDPHWVDAGARFFFTKLNWVGPATFEVHPEYADTYPSQYNGRGPRWPQAGSPVGHAEAPIRVRHVSGPVVPAGPDRLRMHFDALTPATGTERVTFLAYSRGDRNYRYTEQVGMVPRGFRGLTKGREQIITFPPLPDLAADAGPVSLGASSDSGLPVRYYVAHGPAEVVDGRLEIRELPARAVYPLEIEVVAWQFGSAVEPLVKTAVPVVRTLRIVKPEV